MFRETDAGLYIPDDLITCDICGIVIPDREELLGAVLPDGTVLACCPRHEGTEEFKRLCRKYGITDSVEDWKEVKQQLDEERSP